MKRSDWMSNIEVSLTKKRLLHLLLILAVALLVRGLTAQFIGARLADPGWFPYGIYAVFDRQAQDGLDARTSFLWIDDPSNTDAAIYPPGYPLWLATIYRVTGIRSAAVVQKVQWVLDALSVLLIVGAGITSFGWRSGLVAGWLAALWPLPAIYGATPLADAPTAWIVLAGAWMLLLAARRNSLRFAIVAGALVGLSCWFRGNAMFLTVFWVLALLILVSAPWRRRVTLSASLAVAAILVMAPVVIRNIAAFHAFVPTGMGIGTNLWEGIGEDERGIKEFGAVYGDDILLEQERIELGIPLGAKFNLYYPNGVERDRKRTRRAMAVIVRHPIWYSGLVLRRMAGVLKFAGTPSPIYGSSGFNLTAKKTLPPAWQNPALALPVNVLGMIQSVLRFLLLPLMLFGLVFALRADGRFAGLLLATVLYYLVVGSMIHTHIRYGLPMHGLLTIFAAIALVRSKDLIANRWSKVGSKGHLESDAAPA
ncbi:MAG: glycosyltransferase family 39 protein [Pyrinomonadaceae bacterium]